MKKKELNRLLFNSFKETLKELNFKKVKIRFKKEYKNFTLDFGFAIVDYYNLFPTTFGYYISYHPLNKILSEIYNKDTSEYVSWAEHQHELFLLKKYPIQEYTITTEEDALNMVKEVTAYMKDVAIPYLESISNFSALDKIYNENPTRPEFGVRGLILAKMAQNPQYDKLKKAYRQLFVDKNWAVQEDIDNLEKTIQFLDKHSFEELEKIANS